METTTACTYGDGDADRSTSTVPTVDVGRSVDQEKIGIGGELVGGVDVRCPLGTVTACPAGMHLQLQQAGSEQKDVGPVWDL